MGLIEDVNFILVGDREIRRLNRRYLRHDRATDVLAFGRDPREPSAAQAPFGEVVISVETARRQAREEGHPVGREIAILATHGLLHLLGYDDRRPAARRRIWRKTETLLKKGGF